MEFGVEYFLREKHEEKLLQKDPTNRYLIDIWYFIKIIKIL